MYLLDVLNMVTGIVDDSEVGWSVRRYYPVQALARCIGYIVFEIHQAFCLCARDLVRKQYSPVVFQGRHDDRLLWI